MALLFPAEKLKNALPVCWIGAFILFVGMLMPPSAGSESSQSLSQNSPSGSGLGLMQAVQITLYEQPAVLISRQDVVRSRGNLQTEAGVFDPALTSSFDYQVNAYAPTYYENYLYGIGDRTYTTTQSSIGLQKKTRYGFSFGPSVQIARSHGITDYMLPTSSNQSIVFFTVNVPLLKGRGKEAADADEMAAEENLKASILDLEQTISESVLKTTQAYWQYLSAQRALAVLKQMEEDARKTLNDTRELVEADQQPASDLETFEANLAQKISERVAGEQVLFQARQDLGLAMGLAYGAINSLPLPADPFPDAETRSTTPIIMNPDALFQKAVTKRADFLALKKKENAARILLTASKNNVLPQLDINAGVGYAGLQDGGDFNEYFQSLGKNATGANYQAGITLTYPFGNNAAEGQVLQQRADLQEAVIQTRDLERKINSGIQVAVQALWRALRELKETRSSVTHYQQAVKNEQIKFTMGMASVLDVINIQDRLRNVRLSEVRQMGKYADAVVQLGYETGTLVAADGDGYRIEMSHLTAPTSP